ncbi:YkvA family protein [Pseudomonas sp. MN1F]|uniref:YkvA family protein n=1 Tax=Pseudomonas sp. MN1F TaxID=1366632 RepID=UPI00128F828D|nr:YkvA family protein [Pseudomonas sp. MN1F]MQG93922.1 DUF1232 domain-containing protein [Pseudomonas sp. MN1F]
MKALLDRGRRWAKSLKRQTMVLWFCYQHPTTPWLPKWIAVFVVAYALSPIDLIPDFIPVLGYLDDVIILPLGIMLAIRLMPPAVLVECQDKALAWEQSQEKRPVSITAAVLIILIWIAAVAGAFLAFTHS